VHNTDSAFTIGATHKICQDYAESYQKFVLLSDGCSSAKLTDFGSRLLVRAAVPYIKRDSWHASVISEAKTYCRTLRLPYDCLHATLLAISLHEDKFFRVIHTGDGFVVTRARSGEIRVKEIGSDSGAPYYLYYESDEGLAEGYIQTFGSSYNVKLSTILPNGEVIDTGCFAYPVSTMVSKKWDYDLEEYDLVAIMSDGVNSFVESVDGGTSIQNKRIPSHEIISELLAFKGYKGEFVQRRFNKAFETFCKKGWKNLDDVSIAVIWSE